MHCSHIEYKFKLGIPRVFFTVWIMHVFYTYMYKRITYVVYVYFGFWGSNLSSKHMYASGLSRFSFLPNCGASLFFQFQYKFKVGLPFSVQYSFLASHGLQKVFKVCNNETQTNGQGW